MTGCEKKASVCVIGAGNVATHLAAALCSVADIRQVISRDITHARRLAETVGNDCSAADSTAAILPDCDFYLISVNDDNIAGIAEETPDFPGIWVHTSGSVPQSVFAGVKSRYGVFYPLQTFTRDVEVDVSKVPVFIEGSDSAALDALATLARGISNVVEVADSARRKSLHVAAVFACNFANLMWMEADGILKTAGLGVNCLMPLLDATLQKLNKVSPRDAMTGPARRGDIAVMQSHLAMLPAGKKQIYRLLSNRIIEEFGNGIEKL